MEEISRPADHGAKPAAPGATFACERRDSVLRPAVAASALALHTAELAGPPTRTPAQKSATRPTDRRQLLVSSHAQSFGSAVGPRQVSRLTATVLSFIL